MKLYLAYGANTNFGNMANRCPDARYVGNVTLADHRLVFRGVADVVPHKGAKVVCAMWVISPSDEEALDGFEGFPNTYVKRYVTLRLSGKRHRVMFYVMRTRRYEALPSQRYEETLRKGYADCGMDLAQIDRAMEQAKAWQAKHGAPARVGHGSWAPPKPPAARPESPEIIGVDDDDAVEQFLLSFYESEGKQQ